MLPWLLWQLQFFKESSYQTKNNIYPSSSQLFRITLHKRALQVEAFIIGQFLLIFTIDFLSILCWPCHWVSWRTGLTQFTLWEDILSSRFPCYQTFFIDKILKLSKIWMYTSVLTVEVIIAVSSCLLFDMQPHIIKDLVIFFTLSSTQGLAPLSFCWCCCCCL